MFWDKKKREEGLPDLPDYQPMNASLSQANPYAPMMEDSPPEEIHDLPSFPDSPMQQGFSQAAIKEAVASEESAMETSLPEPRSESMPKNNYNLVEMEEWTPKPLPTYAAPRDRSSKPIFVRIDKYQLAYTSLDTIRAKLQEVESLLKKVRDTKTREETELAAWESEMENLKGRIQGVMTEIFDKAE